MTAPDGYVPYSRTSGYLALIGPVYEAADGSGIGLRIDERHTNARGYLHAGLLVALADVLMGHTAQRAAPPGSSLVTASLTTDFISSARSGDWVRGEAAIRHVGRRLAFGGCEFTVDGRLVLAASGVFAVRLDAGS
jgi:uncharacterized protein (TIGR00369 family)